MLTLNDGRSELWQWDTGRKLNVDADCSQVHFSNKVFGRSIDVDVVDSVAIIPDILLQTDKELTAWAFVGTPENGYTKISKVFKVNKRNKPADYVFTLPEQTSLEEILEKIDYLESIQDPDAIKNAVEDYLEQNPVEATVQSVNGKTGDVKLIAEDVGAISRDKLQEATNEALAQAKASGEFDGEDGQDGVDGSDGITPHIGNNGNWFIGTTDTGKPSRGADGQNGKDGKDGAQGEQGIQGVQGEKGDTGANGVSATHSWNGTVLTVTSASGTSSADLKGAKGDTGAQGIQGEKGATGEKGEKGDKGDTGATGTSGKDGADGKDGASVTVKSVSESSVDGGNNVVTFSDGKTMTVKNGSKGSTGGKGADGVSPTVAVSKTGKVTTVSITDANGTKTATINDGSDGASGKDGTDATVTAESVTNALGYTPMNPEEAFTSRQSVTPDYTNQVPLSVDESGNILNDCGFVSGKRLDGSGALVDNSSTYVSGFIPIKAGDVIRIKDPNRATFSTGVQFALYKSDKASSSGLGKTVEQIMGDSTQYGTLTINGSVATWTLNPLGYYYWKNVTWLRVTTFSPDMVVTVNEPMTESVKEQFILKPEVKVTEDSLGFELSDKPLAGKTIVGFGDSIFGYVRDSSSVLSVVAEETGATVHNVGFSGCRMSVHPTSGYAAFSMWALAKAIAENNWATQDAQAASGSSYFPEQLALLKSIDFNGVDMVIIHYGTNDFAAGNPGVAIDNDNDYDDYNTLCGALRYSVEKLLSAYPHLQIFVSLPAYRYWSDSGKYPETYTNYLGKRLPEYVDALRNVATEYNLPVIDSYYGLGVNKLNVTTMTDDGTHHSLIGRKRLGEFIAGHLNGRQACGKSGMDFTAVQKLIDASIAAIPVYNGEVI